MGFSAVAEFKDVGGGFGREERKEPCRQCRALIGLKPPVILHCFACWVGHPPSTKPVWNLSTSPYYLAALARIQATKERTARRRAAKAAAGPQLVDEVMTDALVDKYQAVVR